jgi:hypothetical protein
VLISHGGSHGTRVTQRRTDVVAFITPALVIPY